MTRIKNKKCFICERIFLIKKGKNPYFVMELGSSYVVLGDHQFYKGYTILLSKIHSPELHLLPRNFRKTLLNEMSIVGEAIFKTFKPKKLNYELLGNKNEHIHWHIFPRYANDPNPTMPIWVVDKSIRYGKKADLPRAKLDEYKKRLAFYIKKLLLKRKL